MLKRFIFDKAAALSSLSDLSDLATGEGSPEFLWAPPLLPGQAEAGQGGQGGGCQQGEGGEGGVTVQLGGTEGGVWEEVGQVLGQQAEGEGRQAGPWGLGRGGRGAGGRAGRVLRLLLDSLFREARSASVRGRVMESVLKRQGEGGCITEREKHIRGVFKCI